jgi:MerR family transcriptional regulator, thiopeptide resistance regulator
MIDSLDIAKVARLTGLSSRAIRFYEARGLIKPLRSASGRRYFGSGELERLHQIMILKAAGLSLGQMLNLFSRPSYDLPQMLGAQMQLLNEQKSEIERAQQIIAFTLARIDRGEPVNAETLCSLIESGDKMMQQEPKEWRVVNERYFSPEQRARWAEAWSQLGDDFDQDQYGKEWEALGREIEAAFPMAPEGELAQNFVSRWYGLLAPFAKVATPDMWNGAVAMYENMDEWAGTEAGQANPGFSKSVWDFMKKATAARLATSAMAEPLAPSYGDPNSQKGDKI